MQHPPPPPPPPPPYPLLGGFSVRDPREGPPWLEAFLGARYFDPCLVHVFNKNEKNHFCIDCVEGPLCARGLREHHGLNGGGAGHRTLQVRRASHADGVRVENIAKLIDISGIQTYIINNHRIVFLLRQAKGGSGGGGGAAPPPPPHGSVSRHCQTCGRVLSADPMRFCSIKCKLVAIKHQTMSPPLLPSVSVSWTLSLSVSSSPPPVFSAPDSAASPWRFPPEYGYGGLASFQELRRKFNLSLTAPDSPCKHHGSSLLSPVSVLHVLRAPPPPASCSTATGMQVSGGVCQRSAYFQSAPEANYTADSVMLRDDGGDEYMEEERRRLEAALIHGMLASQRRKRRKGSPRRAPLF